MSHGRAQRGFTLIELMIVVGIIAILSSLAIPTFTILTIRAKTAERDEIMLRIKKAIADYYVRRGNTIALDGTSLESRTPQPAVLPGSTRLMPDFSDPADHWVEIFRANQEIEGSLYFQYSFVCTEPTGTDPATLTVTSTGDLDADGVPYTKWIRYSRVDGAYVVLDEAVDTYKGPAGAF